MTEPKLNLSAQHNIFNPKLVRPVTLIGAGAVGSHIAIDLACLGVTDLTVYDHDHVESHNICMSAFHLKDLGRHKVDALADHVMSKTGLEMKTVAEKYMGQAINGSLVVSVDSMEARQYIWEKAKMEPSVDILLDTRLAAELVSVFAINPCDPDDIEYYEYFLSYSSREAHHETCGRHGIKYVSETAARAVCANLTSWWSRGRKKRHHKELVGNLRFID